MATVKIIQTRLHEITLPADFTPPLNYAEMIGGTFSQINDCSNISGTPLQPCRVRVANSANMSHRRKLINEFNLLQGKINNFEYFLRPICIAEDMQRLMYSSFEIHPPRYTILPCDNLSQEQKWVVAKQILKVLSYLQTKEIVLNKLEETDFEILCKGNDIRVKIHLLNTDEKTHMLLQKSIKNIGLALMKINWPFNAQHIESKLQGTTELSLSEVATVFNQLSMTSNEYLLVSMLLTMIRVPKGSRPGWSDLLKHPYFWTPLYKKEFIETVAPPKVDGSKKIDPFSQWQKKDKMLDLIEINSQEDRPNSYGSYEDNNYKNLIKLCRDKYVHRDEIMKKGKKHHDQCTKLFGTKDLDITTYLSFFETRFPKLLMWLWHEARKEDMTKELGLNQFYPRSHVFVKQVREMLKMRK